MNFARVLKGKPEDVSAITVAENQCYNCARFQPEKGAVCEAFPDGIPLVILLAGYDHTLPFEQDGMDDQGLRFEPKED